jgi:hypothetical protein
MLIFIFASSFILIQIKSLKYVEKLWTRRSSVSRDCGGNVFQIEMVADYERKNTRFSQKPVWELESWQDYTSAYSKRILFALFYFFLLGSINLIYSVYHVNEYSIELLLFQVSVALYNLFMINCLLPILIENGKYSMRLSVNDAELMYCTLSSVSAIIIPCIVTFLSSDLCFSVLSKYVVFNEQPMLSRDKYFEFCSLSYRIGKVVCNRAAIEKSSDNFALPFMYSEQCRNALLESYIPIIIIMNIYTTFVQPIVYLIAMMIEYESMPVLIRMFFPSILWPRHIKVSYFMLQPIVTQYVMLTLFGISSPACCASIALAIYSSGQLLKYLLLRCIKQHFLDEDPTNFYFMHYQ